MSKKKKLKIQVKGLKKAQKEADKYLKTLRKISDTLDVIDDKQETMILKKFGM